MRILRDPTKWIISIGFSATLSIMSIATYLALSHMDEVVDQMTQLIEKEHVKNTSTHNMRALISNRGEILFSMLLTDDFFERDDLLLEFYKLAKTYEGERDSLKTVQLSPTELKLINKLRPLINKAQELNNETAEMLLSTASDDELKSQLKLTLNQRKPILLIVDELINAQEEQALQTLNNDMFYHAILREIIIYLLLASFCIVILIALLVIRQSTARNSEIQHQASHDSLTQLPNRIEFENRLDDLFHDAVENHTEHALCYIDLDHFKIVNDTSGHKAGDQLLIDITNIIKENIRSGVKGKMRSSDILGRLGGDEFGLLLCNCPLSKAQEIAQGLIALVKQYEFAYEDRTFHIGASIGIVSITDKTKSQTIAMSDADIACYAAKDMGRNCVHVNELSEAETSNKQKELHWVANIQNSIKDDRFELHVQPITPIQNNLKSSMYEVLLRLKDDDGNIISPGHYIPIAERFGLMRDVDSWVIERAFEYIQKLNSNNPSNTIKLFINLSANSLTDQRICDFIIEKLDSMDIPGENVGFEITETSAIKNILQANNIITKLKTRNIEFSLDDFGSGMSSFGYLKNLQVDYLKIDGSFVVNMTKNTIDQAMVAAINKIGSMMDIKTIAEHVEDEETVEILKELNVNYAQGYFFAKPQSIETLFSPEEHKKDNFSAA